MTYSDYLIKVTETIKIRSVNYRLSQNDIIYMTNNVYTEIMSRVNITPTIQEIFIDADTKEYKLDALDIPIGNTLNLNVYKIVNDEGVNIGRYFREVTPGVYIVKEGFRECFMDEYEGKAVYFHRTCIPDIELMDSRVQLLIFEAIINGIMYYTHGAIPSPTASNVPFNETGMYYKLYDGSITALMNMFPQR